MKLQEKLTQWQNIWLAYQSASRGKRGRGATAAFEMLLADNLLELQKELEEKTYQPGEYHNFYIHEPKKRLISAAPFRDRVVHHALCNLITPYFEKLFIQNSVRTKVLPHPVKAPLGLMSSSSQGFHDLRTVSALRNPFGLDLSPLSRSTF